MKTLNLNSIKFPALIFLYTLLFLFYPGDSWLFHTFAYNRELFDKPLEYIPVRPVHVAYPKYSSYVPFLTAEGVYIVDLDTFSPVFERNAHEHLYPASTTKILTALVAMDVFKTDDIITVKRDFQDGQVMGLFQGERITVETLLYGALVHSGNDAAYALADAYGYDKFIDLMNKKASELKMSDSHFKNPAGLDEDGQLSSPFDLALAGRELLKNKLLKKIVSTKEIILSDVDYKKFHTLSNVNKLLGEIQGIGGLKTGYTENAGENLVSFYRKDGHQLLIVIMKSQDRFNDTRTAVKWIDENVSYFTLH
ncbi:D-alanyl-D-alanine carboxypeptidase [Candidatus Roizmanbacteria bacterium]|nr:D-alanyl-D-alanine carboxypeptidase [Candidatus Roizmanbacteria bacterium]